MKTLTESRSKCERDSFVKGNRKQIVADYQYIINKRDNKSKGVKMAKKTLIESMTKKTGLWGIVSIKDMGPGWLLTDKLGIMYICLKYGLECTPQFDGGWRIDEPGTIIFWNNPTNPTVTERYERKFKVKETE